MRVATNLPSSRRLILAAASSPPSSGTATLVSAFPISPQLSDTPNETGTSVDAELGVKSWSQIRLPAPPPAKPPPNRLRTEHDSASMASFDQNALSKSSEKSNPEKYSFPDSSSPPCCCSLIAQIPACACCNLLSYKCFRLRSLGGMLSSPLARLRTCTIRNDASAAVRSRH